MSLYLFAPSSIFLCFLVFFLVFLLTFKWPSCILLLLIFSVFYLLNFQSSVFSTSLYFLLIFQYSLWKPSLFLLWLYPLLSPLLRPVLIIMTTNACHNRRPHFLMIEALFSFFLIPWSSQFPKFHPSEFLICHFSFLISYVLFIGFHGVIGAFLFIRLLTEF